MTPVYPRQNVGRRGTDLMTGDVVLHTGELINSSRVGALAAAGRIDVEVYARPSVAILSTGNEIVEPGRPLGPAQIYDVNRHTLSAVVAAHGGEAVVLPTAPDAIAELTAAVERAASAEIVLFSGGSSVGEKDLILDVLRASGEVLFHGIAVKPGKPTVFGRVRRRPVLGMPGNPTSCLSNAYLLLVPLLRRTARLPDYTPHIISVPLARRIVSTTGRHQFYTVRIENGTAVPAFKASGDITSMSRADGYIEIPAQTDIVEAGQLVDVKLF
jgi:molybdenum cofactor synthesis domain-containing protein